MEYPAKEYLVVKLALERAQYDQPELTVNRVKHNSNNQHPKLNV